MAKAANDLAHDSQNTFVAPRIDHVPLALWRLNGHHLSGQIASALTPSSLVKLRWVGPSQSSLTTDVRSPEIRSMFRKWASSFAQPRLHCSQVGTVIR
jgi:hypothetical protein